MAPVLLLVAVVGSLRPPPRVPAWVIPLVCSLVIVVSGSVAPDDLPDLLSPLIEPLAFLTVAVPFALLLDRTGLFDRVAATLAARAGALWMLWCLAAAVTAFLNLDTAIVLLTPVYLRLARLVGRDPVTVALIPAVLALLASSFLPVSNLTNLIAVETFGISTAGFLANLGMPSLAAVVVGWFCYRRVTSRRIEVAVPVGPADGGIGAAEAIASAGAVRGTGAEETGLTEVVEDSAGIGIGAAVITMATVGLVVGPILGLAPWIVLLVADVVLVAWNREVPWQRLPVDLVVLVLSLAVCAFATADALGLTDLRPDNSVPALAATLFGSAAGSNLVNNLPAFLVGRSAVAGGGDCQVWALLLGSNIGPGVALSGALSSLLWVSIVRGEGYEMRAGRFARLGLSIVLPAFLVAAAVFLAKAATLGC